MRDFSQTQIDQRRAQLREELKALDEAEAELKLLTPEQRDAIALHQAMCRYDHTDQCGWLYEDGGITGHNWNGSAHRLYLDKARALSEVIPVATFLAAYDAFNRAL